MNAARTAAEATEQALGAIERWNPIINAMITVTADAARARAAELDQISARGESAGPLHGLVLNLKDCIDWAGTPTTAASVILRDNRPSRHAHITERLVEAGAILIGKANLHEWVFGPTSQSLHFGPVANPWNTAHVPGGSSGGSGASVASGMADVSIGSDTAGSIRLPAAFCGLAGLRPSVGRISRRGSIAVSAPFDTVGPLARRVSDVAKVFQVIAGHDPEDALSIDRPVPDVMAGLNAPIRGKRIGIMRRWFFDDIDAELRQSLDQAIGVFQDLGAEIVDLDLGDVERAQDMLAFRIVLADAFELHRAQLAQRPGDYGQDLMVRYELGKQISGADYAEALRWIEGWRKRLDRLFAGGIDAMLSPATPGAAPLRAGLAYASAIRSIPRFMSVFASAGVPSLALPCGFNHAGLPLSLELSGRAFDEPTVLQLGHAFQSVTEHHLKQARHPGEIQQR